MPSINISEVSWRFSPFGAGLQRKGALWSNLRQVCQLLQITPPAPVEEEILFQHVHYQAGERIHAIGEAFDTLYILHSGFLKTSIVNEFGNEQVLRFPMRGDILGIDGIGARHYTSEAVALTNCGLILLPYKKLVSLGRVHLELENNICGAMSRVLTREYATIRMLAARGAEAKMACFLLALADRFAEMGYSNKLFTLRMTRQEIGNYLGITLETVSRTLSSFNEMGLITVDQRTIGINNADTLRTWRRLPVTQGLEFKQKAEGDRPRDSAGNVNRRLNDQALGSVK